MKFTREEKLAYEMGRRSYFEIQKRKSELSEADKKLFERLEAVEIGRYDVSSSIVLMIANVYSNNAINAFSTIFRLGFMKGIRKGKREAKNGKNNG